MEILYLSSYGWSRHKKNNLTDDKWKYYTYPVMDGHATILPDTQQKFKYCYMKTFYIAGYGWSCWLNKNIIDGRTRILPDTKQFKYC